MLQALINKIIEHIEYNLNGGNNAGELKTLLLSLSEELTGLTKNSGVNQYIVIGTYPNQNKTALTVWAINTSEAIIKAIESEKQTSGSHFINIDVIDTYGDLKIIR